MLSEVYSHVPPRFEDFVLPDPKRPEYLLPATELSTALMLLFQHHQPTLINTSWYRRLVAHAQDKTPFPVTYDSTGCLSPIFDPNYFALVINRKASSHEMLQLGVMTVHDIVHVIYGDVAPYTIEELHEARQHLLEGDYSWQPTRTSEEYSSVQQGYVKAILEIESEAYIHSDFILPFTLGSKFTREVIQNDALANIIENQEESLDSLIARVKSIYRNPDNTHHIESETLSDDMKSLLTKVVARARTDQSLASLRFSVISTEDSNPVKPWCYLFLENIHPAGDVQPSLIDITKNITNFVPYENDNIKRINEYLNAQYRNGAMLREIVSGSTRFNGAELYRKYLGDLEERKALVECFTTGDSYTGTLLARANDYPLPLPLRVPPLEKRQFPYLGRTISTRNDIILTAKEEKVPFDSALWISFLESKRLRCRPTEPIFPHDENELSTLATKLNEAKVKFEGELPRIKALPDDYFTSLPAPEACTIGGPPGLECLPDLLVYGYEHLGLSTALETQFEKNWSQLSPEQKIDLLKNISLTLCGEAFSFNLCETASGTHSFPAINFLLAVPLYSETGPHQGILDREALAATNYWLDFVVRPALGFTTPESEELREVIEQYEPSFGYNLFRLHYCYGRDLNEVAQEYFNSSELQQFDKSSLQHLSELMDRRYGVSELSWSFCRSLLLDPQVQSGFNSIVQTFSGLPMGNTFKYRRYYKPDFQEIIGGCIGPISSLALTESRAIGQQFLKLVTMRNNLSPSTALHLGEILYYYAAQAQERIEALAYYGRQISGKSWHISNDGVLPIEEYRELYLNAIELKSLLVLLQSANTDWIDSTQLGETLIVESHEDESEHLTKQLMELKLKIYRRFGVGLAL